MNRHFSGCGRSGYVTRDRDGSGEGAMTIVTIQGIVGEELTVNAYLTAAVGAFGQGTADAANTFRFFLTPVGDFTYTTASGNSYVQQVQPVAEPATLLLLGIGVALPFWRARWLNAGRR
jgi:hypothetical protein